MKLKYFIAMPAIAFAIAGCEGAVVSDYNGASVKIQTDFTSGEAMAEAMTEAQRICGTAGKRAEFASTRPTPGYTYEHLYLCL